MNKVICGVQLRKLFILGLLLAILVLPPPVSADDATNSTVYTIEQTHRLTNYSTTAASSVVAHIILFDNHTGYADQQILSELIEVDDVPVVDGVNNTITETEENRIAHISLGTIGPGATKTITVANTIMVTQVGPIDESDVHGIIPVEMLEYTQPIPYLWESDDPVIRDKALELIAGKPNVYDQVRAIFEFVENHMTYQQYAEEHSALWAYYSENGDCSEFTHLFSALCRAAGIPTKFVIAYGYNPLAGGDLTAQGHAFAFVYLPGVGWAPMDLTWGYPLGEFAMLNKDHIIEMMSYGSNLVRGENICIPGNMWNYSPSGLNLQLVSSGQIVRETEVKPLINTAASIEGDIWKFYVTVTNTGTQPVENLNVELFADDTYLEVPGAQSIASLGPGNNQALTFDVRVKESVVNSIVTARVTYDYIYGAFFDEGQITVSNTLPTQTETTTTSPTQTTTTTSPTQTGTTTSPTQTGTTTSPTQTVTTTSPPPTEGPTNYLVLLVVVIVIIGVVAGVVVALRRR
jgi:hypothetical protein